MMPSKKARLPELVKQHLFYPDQYSKLNKTKKDFTKPSKAKPIPLERSKRVKAKQSLETIESDNKFALTVLQLCGHFHFSLSFVLQPLGRNMHRPRGLFWAALIILFPLRYRKMA